MRIVALPDSVEGDRRTLGPPEGMSDEDCATIEVLSGVVILPSGTRYPAVSALVQMDEAELAQVVASGGHFWVQFLGQTFPPVLFMAPTAVGSSPEETKPE